MAILFFAIGLVALVLGAATLVVSIIAGLDLIYAFAGLSTVGSSLGFFAVYAIIDRLDKLVGAKSERRAADRIEPTAM